MSLKIDGKEFYRTENNVLQVFSVPVHNDSIDVMDL